MQVKSAAFQALGPFISTFADPKKTGLFYNDSGVVVEDVRDEESSGSIDSGCSIDSDPSAEESKECGSYVLPSYVNNPTTNEFVQPVTESSDNHQAGLDILAPSENTGREADESLFNTFQYWRLPISEVPLEFVTNNSSYNPNPSLEESQIKIEGGSAITLLGSSLDAAPTTSNDESKASSSDTFESFNDSLDANSLSVDTESDLFRLNTSMESGKTLIYVEGDNEGPNTFDASVPFFGSSSNFIVPSYSEAIMSHTTNISFNFSNGVAQYKKVLHHQDIIPNELLEHYLSMTNPINYQTVDQDLTHHCAYALPAVALTLGRKHWPCLKETYELLALDMQWKVRWTLATSLHQMALILGPELTSRDLLPVFLSFMKDLDEVRYGILQNLAAILRLLNRPEQLGILPKISEFLKMDNNRNWRIRYTLCEQVVEIAQLYEPAQIKEHLFPIAFILMKDKVSEVRLGAIQMLSTLLHSFFSRLTESDQYIFDQMTTDLISQVDIIVKSPKWIFRQVYVLLCEQLITNQSLPNEIFLRHFWENLLMLSSDNVPNVRLALSRCLARTLPSSGKYKKIISSLMNCTFAELLQSCSNDAVATLNLLKSDPDRDVRRYAKSTFNSDGVFVIANDEMSYEKQTENTDCH